MMSRTLGAPLGGTMVGGHHGLESLEFSLITPPNFGSGAGIWFPSIVVVALGEPDTPVTCCAKLTGGQAALRHSPMPIALRIRERNIHRIRCHLLRIEHNRSRSV